MVKKTTSISWLDLLKMTRLRVKLIYTLFLSLTEIKIQMFVYFIFHSLMTKTNCMTRILA